MSNRQKSVGNFANIDTLVANLRSAPIDSKWVLSGQPLARSAAHSATSDGGASTNVWDCGSGVFLWHFSWDETALILEGEVIVTSSAGVGKVLRCGDLAYFPAGTRWTWEVPTYVRKLAFHRRPPSRLDRIVRKARGIFPSSITRRRVALGFTAAVVAASVLIICTTD
jgi:uncharacterized protein